MGSDILTTKGSTTSSPRLRVAAHLQHVGAFILSVEELLKVRSTKTSLERSEL